MDLKNNRYTLMPLKRNQACLVCGKDGTTKSAVRRIDLPLHDIRTRGNLERSVRHLVDLQGTMTLLSENETGELKINNKSKYRPRKGDYVKVLVEDHEGDMN